MNKNENEMRNFNGMTKDEYLYVLGLTENHPNQVIILDFIREMLKSTSIRCYYDGYHEQGKRASEYLKAVANGTAHKMEGGLHGFDTYMHDQWEKIPTTQDKVNRIHAARAVRYISELKDKEAKQAVLDRIGSRTAGVGHTTEYRRRRDFGRALSEWQRRILRNGLPINQELVDIGKEQLQRRNERGYNDHAYGGQWGNYATPCEYPRDVTGKLLKPGHIIIARSNTEEALKNGEFLTHTFPFAIDSWDELRMTDVVVCEIGEVWELIYDNATHDFPKGKYSQIPHRSRSDSFGTMRRLAQLYEPQKRKTTMSRREWLMAGNRRKDYPGHVDDI